MKENKKKKNTRKALKHFVLFFVAISVLSIGLYFLSTFSEEEPYLERPIPTGERVPQYEKRINSFGEACGYEQGNCKICLECVDEDMILLTKQNFKEETKKTGYCRYIEENLEDKGYCNKPYKRCNGEGNCVECFEDEHCGDCKRCAVDFFNYPSKSKTGKCIPRETKKGKPCNLDEENIGVCFHGDCIECFKDTHCSPPFTSCSEDNKCV